MTTPLGSPVPSPVQDVVLVAARLLLGVILIAHGWQKLDDFGLGGTTDNFDAMGIPVPRAAALFAIGVEIGGGALLILGLLTPLVGVLVAVNMAGAYCFAHRDAGLFAADGGWELVAVIGLAAVAIGMVGPGRVSVDHAVLSRRGSRQPVAA